VDGDGCVERSDAPDHTAALCGVDQHRSRQRGQLGQRRGKRLLEKYRLRHSIRRSPADLHTRVPAPKKRSRPLLLFRGVLVTRTLVRSLQATLERCAAAKLELLHAVKLTLRKLNRIVE